MSEQRTHGFTNAQASATAIAAHRRFRNERPAQVKPDVRGRGANTHLYECVAEATNTHSCRQGSCTM
eukprot:10939240-Alexandrium_andersonii.AAC.1